MCCVLVPLTMLPERSPRYAREPRAGSLLPDALLEDICVFFASFRFWSPDWRSMG